MKDNNYSGNFVVVEGADGSGTTTQSKRLAEQLDAHWTCEPADNMIGRKVDELISGGEHDPETVALSFAADRMVHLEEEVIPRLEKGETVVCDRYYHSSLVYQPIMGADYDWVRELNRDAVKPDVTVILDVSADIGMSRVDSRGRDGNIFEDMDFQQQVVVRYRQLKDKLEEEVNLLDASRPIEEVYMELEDLVQD